MWTRTARCGPSEPAAEKPVQHHHYTDSSTRGLPRDLTGPYPLRRRGGEPVARPSPLGAEPADKRTDVQPRRPVVAVVTMKQLLEAGVHFGHQTRRWNPKMRRFIFGERNGIYIIDLQQTLERIDTAYRFIRRTVEDGGNVLFVGTKKQAQEPIQNEAQRSGMPYVNYRWLGGMLTNFQTVHSRVSQLRELERLVQSGETAQMPKKEALKITRDLTKLQRNLGGI